MRGRQGAPLRLLLLTLGLVVLAGLARCRGPRGRSRLALWIDSEQVELLIGMPMTISIINEGQVTPYLKEPGLSEAILIPPEVDTVNLTWQSGHEKFWYWFNFTSLDPRLLYPPLLGVPAYGVIPRDPTVFQITIPCKGVEEGVASLVLGLTIYSRDGRPLKGTPIKFKLKKQCVAFVTTSLCSGECQNGGTCTQFGQCECRQGFQGEYCQIALCDPVCKNNGTCISPEICDCPKGYSGKLCEIAACERPCENGGHCLPEGFCWCEPGYYGDSCELRIVSCTPNCANGGTCVDVDRCQCPSNFSGPRCETKEERPRRSKTNSKEQQRRNKSGDKRTRSRRHKLEKKVEKAERRLLKVLFQDGKSWQLSREERRVLRRLQREKHTGLLPRKDRKFLVRILTRERGHLKKKYKKSLRRYKKLLKKMRKTRKKPRKKKKKFV
ncbi:uncharacterized protein LOC143285218 [Babylonia areolata]|uniref:uncharacterized protein LOC143285218 n=1 Tax=Babylonia areolata TaxID=304850 RepID=UPI003FD684A3